MSIIDAGTLATAAQRAGYAVAAINTQGGNYDIVRAIIEVAEEERSPVILAAYEGNLEYYGFEWFGEYARWAAGRASVPIALHLDHSRSIEAVLKAIRNGFTSVMIDYSTRPLDENIAATSEVIRIARPLGITVEAEIGELQRNENGAETQENRNMVDPKDVAEFLAQCRPDLLAVGIGNAHGFYKGEPNIRIDLLDAVHTLDRELPLVLHGTTGIPEKTVRECIRRGMAKVNYGTIVRHRFLEHMKAGLDGGVDHKGHIWKVARYAMDLTKDEIRTIIRLVGSNGKA